MSDGRKVRLFPFHVSFEGMEKAILYRDDEDYDVAVKYLALAAVRSDIFIVTYIVVSNHLHCVALAENKAAIISFTEDYKRRYAMWIQRKYSEGKVLHSCDVDIQYLDSDRYLRNAMAYDIRNSLDNGAESVLTYKWSSFRSYFCSGSFCGYAVSLGSLTARERRAVMHSGDKSIPPEWIVNQDYELEPVSFCLWEYLEGAFHGDQSFFLRTIGGVNTAEMTETLVMSHRVRQTDMELYKTIEDKATSWYGKSVYSLSSGQKAKLILYIYHSVRTTVAQLARCFGLSREYVGKLLNIGTK